MKNPEELTEEINRLTLKIEQEYPELYLHLGENPITIPNLEHPHMDTTALTDYLDSLEQMLSHYLVSHRTPKKDG